METFSEFEQQAAVPLRNFSDILSHAFNNYFKIIGWSILGFVIYLIISMLISFITDSLVGYDSQMMAEEMSEIASSGNPGDMMSSMFSVPGFRESIAVTSLLGILLSPFFIGIIYMMNRANNGQSVEFSDLWTGFRENYLHYVLYSFLASIGYYIGLLICGIGFFFVLPFFFTGLPVILFEKKNAVDALKKSFATGRENYGTLLGVSFIVTIISIAGVILCGIGIIATLPFFYAAMYSSYLAFNGTPQVQQSNINM